MKQIQKDDHESLVKELRRNMYANQRLHIANRLAELQKNYWRNVAKKFIDEIDIQSNYDELRKLITDNGFLEPVEIID